MAQTTCLLSSTDTVTVLQSWDISVAAVAPSCSVLRRWCPCYTRALLLQHCLQTQKCKSSLTLVIWWDPAYFLFFFVSFSHSVSELNRDMTDWKDVCAKRKKEKFLFLVSFPHSWIGLNPETHLQGIWISWLLQAVATVTMWWTLYLTIMSFSMFSN